MEQQCRCHVHRPDSQYAEPPGTRKPNAWGLYDMVGNDWQWCRTCVGEDEPDDVFTPGKGSSASWYVRGENIYPIDPRRLSCDVRSSASASSGDGSHRLFAQIDNIPFDVTPKALAEMVKSAAKKGDEAAKLFKQARGKGKDAADALGRGFALLESQVNEYEREHLRKGPRAWEEQWKRLEELDADDRFGWRRRFTMGSGRELLEKATSFGQKGETDNLAQLEKTVAAMPTNHLTVTQRQSILLIPFVYAHAPDPKSKSISEPERELLHRILAMGRDTVWGQAALGQLSLAGENIERAAAVRQLTILQEKSGKKGK